MIDTTAHPWRTRILLASGALLLTLCLGCTLPRLLMSDGTEQWSGVEGEAARLARNEVRMMHKAPQHAVTTQIRVIAVEPDPSGCDWGMSAPASGIVTVQTYTLFGIPADRWQVSCGASHLVSSLLP